MKLRPLIPAVWNGTSRAENIYIWRRSRQQWTFARRTSAQLGEGTAGSEKTLDRVPVIPPEHVREKLSHSGFPEVLWSRFGCSNCSHQKLEDNGHQGYVAVMQSSFSDGHTVVFCHLFKLQMPGNKGAPASVNCLIGLVKKSWGLIQFISTPEKRKGKPQSSHFCPAPSIHRWS